LIIGKKILFQFNKIGINKLFPIILSQSSLIGRNIFLSYFIPIFTNWNKYISSSFIPIFTNWNKYISSSFIPIFTNWNKYISSSFIPIIENWKKYISLYIRLIFAKIFQLYFDFIRYLLIKSWKMRQNSGSKIMVSKNIPIFALLLIISLLFYPNLYELE